jgi:drug/metabolite transporter (DMT)-like permease
MTEGSKAGGAPLAPLGVLAAALLFSTGGAAIKACTLTGWQVAALRSAVAALTLVVLLPASRRAWSRRTWLVGASYAATLVLFVLGNKLTTAANTIFLQSTAPLYVLGLGPLLLGERASRRDLGVMVVIAAGLALFFVGHEPVQASAPNPWLGNLLATTAGVTWGLTLMGLRSVGRAPARTTIGASAASAGADAKAVADAGLGAVVAGNLIACGVCLPFALAPSLVGSARTAGSPSFATDALLIGYLGVVQIGMAYVLLTRGFRKVPALEGSLLILLEPALNPIWAWLLQHEVPSGMALLGGGIILGATVVRSLTSRPRMPAPCK